MVCYRRLDFQTRAFPPPPSPHFFKNFMQCFINCYWSSVNHSLWIFYIKCFNRHAKVNIDWRKYTLYYKKSLSTVTSVLLRYLQAYVVKTASTKKFWTVINREKYCYTLFLIQKICVVTHFDNLTHLFYICHTNTLWAWGSAVVKVLRYKFEGPGIDPLSCL